jgi:hypothetical protein
LSAALRGVHAREASPRSVRPTTEGALDVQVCQQAEVTWRRLRRPPASTCLEWLDVQVLSLRPRQTLAVSCLPTRREAGHSGRSCLRARPEGIVRATSRVAHAVRRPSNRAGRRDTSHGGCCCCRRQLPLAATGWQAEASKHLASKHLASKRRATIARPPWRRATVPDSAWRALRRLVSPAFT